MVLHEFSSSPFLNEFIRTYRVVHFHFPNNEKLPCKAYPPKPEHCLSFYPYDVEEVEFADTGKKTGNYKAVLFGMQTEVTKRFVGSKFLVFQIVFKPGALFRLTGIPLHEITNEYLDAEIFFPAEIKNINEQLFYCKTYTEMVNVVETFLFFLVKKKN